MKGIHFVRGTVVALTFAGPMLLLTPAPTLGSQADVERGRALYRTCQACHGAEGQGNAAMNAPRLAGQFPWYLERQLKHFRSGVRGGEGDTYGALMAPMARALPDDQAIADVVAYIATF